MFQLFSSIGIDNSQHDNKEQRQQTESKSIKGWTNTEVDDFALGQKGCSLEDSKKTDNCEEVFPVVSLFVFFLG